MSKLKVCRVCLRNELKLYKFDTYNLKNYYEEIMTLPVSKTDGLPKFFCYECAGVLYKFHMFREKCYYSQNQLTEMLWDGQLTRSAVTSILTKQKPVLKYGQLEILTTNKKVGTFLLEHSPNQEEPLNDNLIEDTVEVDMSDDSLSDYEDRHAFETTVEIPEIIEAVEKKADVALQVSESVTADVRIDSEEEIVQLKQTRSKKAKDKPEKLKEVKKRQPRKKRELKKKKESDKSDTEDDNDEDYNDKKSAERKNVEFTKAKGGKPKVLKFLDSGFWKKSFLSDEEAMSEFHAKAQDRKYLRAAYKCTDCYRGFSQKSMLDRHIPLKHGETLGSLICRFCKCRFRTAYFLNKHMRLHYTRFECLRCNLVCNIDKSALFHEEYHNGVIRKCPHCDKEFKHMSTFYTHLRTHRSKHMCTRCGESFVSQLGLYLHRKVKHINDGSTIDEESTYCEVCKIKFDTAVAYNRHLLHSAMHTEEKVLEDENAIKDLINEDGEDKDLNDSQKPDVRKLLMGITSDYNLSAPLALVSASNNGISINSEELYTRKSRVEKTLSAVRKRNLHRGQPKISKKPTTCQHCGKHFESQTACMKHHHAEHPRKPFYSPQDRVICEICGVSLAPSSVPAHINQHTRRKMYTCDTCGRSFTTNNMLRNHIVTHTGERNHACTICGKRFAQSGSLNLHHRTVHLKQPYPKSRETSTVGHRPPPRISTPICPALPATSDFPHCQVNRRKKLEEPNTEAGPFGGKEEYSVWRHYFDSSTLV